METIRLFIASPISRDIQEALRGLQETGKTKVSSIRWVKPEKIHLTWIFLGWTDSGLQAKIEESIREAALPSTSFDLSVTGLGVFPRLNAPRVVWAGIREEKNLTALHRKLSTAMASLGFPREERPFRPHLTLGRVEKGAVPDSFIRWVAQEKDLEIGRCEIREVVLMKSELKPGGSVYTPLFTSTFGGSSGETVSSA